MTAPLAYQWTGEAMAPLPRCQAEADRQFVVGERYVMEAVEERSGASHRHYFAAVREAWLNLPDTLAQEFPTPEHLRKRALILTGWRDESTFVASSKAEAVRFAAFMRPVDDFALIVVSGCTFTRLTAKSQSIKAMGPKDFQKSKDDVLNKLAEMIGTTAKQIERAAA